MEYPQFTKGQKVRTRYGEIRTVLFQRGCQVFVAEDDRWYHPTKVWPSERLATERMASD